jgi:hypothetical protein
MFSRAIVVHLNCATYEIEIKRSKKKLVLFGTNV